MLREDIRTAGRIDPWTGWVGATYSVVLFLSYAIFLIEHPHGGKLIPSPLSAIFVGRAEDHIGQDFFDVLLMMTLVVGAMASWERLTAVRRKFLFVLLALSSLGHTSVCVTDVAQAGGAGVSAVSLGLLLSLVGYLALFVLEILSVKKRSERMKCDFRTAFSVGSSRFLAGLLVLVPYAALSLSHPHFATSGIYRIFNNFFVIYLLVYLTLGLPWMVFTEWMRHGRDDPKKDIFFPLVCLVTQGRFFLCGQYSRGLRRVRIALRKRFIRFGILDLVVKGFFFPLMIHFMFGELSAISRGVLEATRAGGLTWNAGYTITLHTVLIVDVVIGAIGYIATSRWLQNKSVSVDPTAGGWAIALFCYPPFNSAAAVLFPYSRGTGNWFPDEAVVAQQIVVLLSFLIYAWSTIVFGLRFSNLTNRGVVDHGPYRYVRHPAYVSKSLGWWAEHSIKFESPWHATSLFFFCGLYALRALTEERHLRADPEYRAYAQKVRWRFIPGLI